MSRSEKRRIEETIRGGIKPNPGSDAAMIAGCTCPVLDNNHGEGAYSDAGGRRFWINDGCPLHASKSTGEDE